MLIHQFTNDTTAPGQGLSSYWGCNTIRYFAPHGAYAAGRRTGARVQAMVKKLFTPVSRVILVLSNHTAEGNRTWVPTLCHSAALTAVLHRLVDGIAATTDDGRAAPCS